MMRGKLITSDSSGVKIGESSGVASGKFSLRWRYYTHNLNMALLELSDPGEQDAAVAAPLDPT
jgi:hypothetical protein